MRGRPGTRNPVRKSGCRVDTLTDIIDAETCLVPPEGLGDPDTWRSHVVLRTILPDTTPSPLGCQFLVNRRELQRPPTAESIRAILAYLQTRADRPVANGRRGPRGHPAGPLAQR